MTKTDTGVWINELLARTLAIVSRRLALTGDSVPAPEVSKPVANAIERDLLLLLGFVALAQDMIDNSTAVVMESAIALASQRPAMRQTTGRQAGSSIRNVPNKSSTCRPARAWMTRQRRTTVGVSLKQMRPRTRRYSVLRKALSDAPFAPGPAVRLAFVAHIGDAAAPFVDPPPLEVPGAAGAVAVVCGLWQVALPLQMWQVALPLQCKGARRTRWASHAKVKHTQKQSAQKEAS